MISLQIIINQPLIKQEVRGAAVDFLEQPSNIGDQFSWIKHEKVDLLDLNYLAD